MLKINIYIFLYVNISLNVLFIHSVYLFFFKDNKWKRGNCYWKVEHCMN